MAASVSKMWSARTISINPVRCNNVLGLDRKIGMRWQHQPISVPKRSLFAICSRLRSPPRVSLTTLLGIETTADSFNHHGKIERQRVVLDGLSNYQDPRVHLGRERSLTSVRRFGTTASRMRQSSNESRADEPIPTFRTVDAVRQWRKDLLKNNLSLGFVPTMGALHAGHLKLARIAAAENDHVIISIYVNPTQFGVNEDLDAYPRTFDSDFAQLKALNAELKDESARGRVTAIFAPTTKEMYPVMPPSSEIDGKGSFVIISPLGQLLEGASRPVFFRGVATVCMKLFNIVNPENVYFGQKDIQQTVVIRRLVKDFHLDINVRIISTEREVDQLAMSSRNVYLGARRRTVAPLLATALRIAADQIQTHRAVERERILRPAHDFLDSLLQDQMALGAEQRVLFVPDYISLADPDTMEELESFDPQRGAIISGAVKMLPLEVLQPGEDQGEAGGVQRPVRLIDNIVIDPVTP